MSVSYTLRMPENLRGFIEIEAQKRGMTTAAFVVNACWCYLEEAPGDREESKKWNASLSTASTGTSLREHGSQSAVIESGRADIEALRAICAMPGSVVEKVVTVVELCPKTGFNEQDGETYRCSLVKGHKSPCRPGERV